MRGEFILGTKDAISTYSRTYTGFFTNPSSSRALPQAQPKSSGVVSCGSTVSCSAVIHSDSAVDFVLDFVLDAGIIPLDVVNGTVGVRVVVDVLVLFGVKFLRHLLGRGFVVVGLRPTWPTLVVSSVRGGRALTGQHGLRGWTHGRGSCRL